MESRSTPADPEGSPQSTVSRSSPDSAHQLTQIEDIAPIVLFLASGGWWITEQTILANGGYTTR